MIRRLVLLLLALGVVLGLVFGWGAVRAHFIAQFLATLSNQVQTVATAPATSSPWQPAMSAVGTLAPVNGANLSAEVSGIVDTLNFESGQSVKAGDVLLTLRANNDPAVLAQLQATAALDEVTYRRDQREAAANAISQAQVDTDKATLLAAQAQVTAQQALMGEKIVKAPFAGTLGIRQINLGQYLTAGTAIVSLQQINPLFVDFYLPQQALSSLSVGQPVSVSIDAYPGQIFAGQISAIDNNIDASTRNVEVRATLPNDKLLLRPGMFATVSVPDGAPQNLVTLPQTAISYNPYGDTVYIVKPGTGADGKPDLVATQLFVTVGDTRGDQVAILKGISAGDQVVTAGQLKLRNGSLVTVNNDVQPPNNANPNPPNE
jgi:membrane fusion protein (multidrug efflux system)